MSVGGSFVEFIDENFGRLAHFVVYAVLEWIMIILLFVEGSLALISYEFANFFDLRIPCLLCTRIDHLLVRRRSDFYYNESICDFHKEDISSLAYCHAHGKLSDIRSMCQGCLLSFAVQKDSVLLQSDVNSFVEDDEDKLFVKKLRRDEERFSYEISSVIPRCSCCGEFLNSKPNTTYKRCLSSTNAPTPSPRAPFSSTGNKHEELNMQLQRYSELKLISDPETELLQEDEDGNHDSKITSEFAPRTPNFGRVNKFFGIPLSDSTHASPRFSNKSFSYKKPSDSFFAEDNHLLNDAEGDVLTRLKRQVQLDRKSLMALHMELDEERSAAAVAANNAMAMITRLQAEKAAVQMEALQYQRMMEEQAEYDQEAIRVMKDLLYKREEDVRELEAELDAYRERYGSVKKIGSGICEIDAEDYQDMKSSSGCVEESLVGDVDDDVAEREFGVWGCLDGGGDGDEFSCLDFERERSYLLDLLRGLEETMNVASEGRDHSFESKRGEEGSTIGNAENKGMLTREVSLIRNRLRAIEAESGFLKHAAMTLQRGEKGTKLLIEIAQHLRKLRLPVKSSSEDTDA